MVSRGNWDFDYYKVDRLFNVIVEHDDLQGDTYWLGVVVIANRAVKVTRWGNQSGRYTIPRFSFRIHPPLVVK